MVIKLKRKLYADREDEKKGMGTGTKVALGAGTLALGFAGARRGLLGTSMMKGTNRIWARAGSALGSNAMMESGAKGLRNATYNEALNAGKTVGVASRESVVAKNDFLKEIGYKKSATPTANPTSTTTTPTNTNT